MFFVVWNFVDSVELSKDGLAVVVEVEIED